MRRVLWLLLAVAAGVLVWLCQGPRPADPERARAQSTVVSASPVPAHEPAAQEPSRPPPEALRAVVERVLAAQPQRTGLRLRRAQTVALVNGTILRATDLFAWHRGDDEREISPQMLAFLLRRAVERELVFQAAKRRGVVPSDAEMRRLEELRGERATRNPDDVDFEVRDLEAEFLLAALAARAGVVSPFANAADVEAYYWEHIDAFDPLPLAGAPRDTARRRIEGAIRQRLAGERQEAYRDAIEALIRQLAAEAVISGA